MTTGIIASRYATALLRYVRQDGSGEVVFSQSEALSKAVEVVPALMPALCDPAAASLDRKMALLHSAAGPEGLCPPMTRFLTLVIRQGRASYLPQILRIFTDRYLRSQKMLRASLVTVVPAPELEKTLAALVKKETGYDLLISARTDPDLIGGFVLTLGDERIDASVSAQLRTLRREFTEMNRRIV